MSSDFTGDKKKLNHFLLGIEKKLISFFLPLVPRFIGTRHLTLMTFLWAVLIIFCGYLAVENIQWLWGFSVCIFLQYITDMLDGAVGRLRNEGYIKWGFYMDHFLDYIFLSSVVIGYSFLLPQSFEPFVLVCLAVCGGFMVHFFLDFSITSEFKISFNSFGVSEARVVMIIFNTVVIFMGKDFFAQVFPFILFTFLSALIFVIFKSQKFYASLDMKQLNNKKPD